LTVPVIAFFNNKGGVGKTTLVYHLAWMFADLGLSVVAADLDPQSNLTAALLDEEIVEMAWDENPELMIYGCLAPLITGTGDIAQPALFRIAERLALIGGDLRLSTLEDELSSQWPQCLDRKERAFRVLSAFWRIMQEAGRREKTDLILVDLGPNLGSINRAALISADYVVIPLSPDLYALQGLKNLGPTFRRWREEWNDRLERKPKMDIQLPAGRMEPLGYVVLQHSVRLDRPVKAYDRWINRIPFEYRENVLSSGSDENYTIQNDPHKLALLKHYRSLIPMAQEAHKPVFHLKPADGAIGAHLQAAREAYKDFKALAFRIAEGADIVLPNAQVCLLNPATKA
jgi:chromosome partitioning protein